MGLAVDARGTEGVPALEAPTVCEAFQTTARSFPDLLAIRTPGDGVRVTWSEYAQRVERVAAGLAALGVGRGDTVGLMMRNRPEFHWCDSAAMHLGAIGFSVYNTSSPEQIEHVVSDAANRVLFTEQLFLDRLAEVAPRLPALEHIVVVDGEAPGAMSLAGLESLAESGFDFEARWRAVAPADVVTLIYTSGTTGPPKGVELTHDNLMRCVRGMAALYPAEPGEITVSYLPMAHLAERSFSHYHAIPRASSVTCVDDPTKVMEVVREVHPTWFVGVPRVWEKVRAALEQHADERLRDALDAGLGRFRAQLAEGEVPPDVEAAAQRADEEVLSHVRAALGFDRIKHAIVGAAPLAPEVIEFFGALGVPLREIWGLTESTGIATVNTPENTRLGTVGKPLPEVEVRIAGDGEILVRGPYVMRGYRNRPEATAEAIDSDGWLHTGDVGKFDEDGFLRLIDRKKELIINAAGKNMSPANIEGRIKLESQTIAHAVAIGDSRPYNVALLALDPLITGGRGPEDAGLREELREAVGRANARLSRVEQIKRFAILGEEWQPGGEVLTPTMKLRRKQINARYADVIESLYADPPPPEVVTV